MTDQRPSEVSRARGIEGADTRLSLRQFLRQTTITEWLLVLITGLQLVAVFGANRLTREAAKANELSNDLSRRLTQASNDETKKSNERAQRAWIMAHDIEGLDLRPSGAGETRMILKNSGASPAQKVVIQATWVLGDLPREIPRRESGPFVSRSLIGPGKEYPTPLAVMGVTAEDAPKVLSGSVPLYLAGRIMYEDAFSSDRETLFCWRYLPSKKHFDFCSVMNEAR